MHIDQSSITSKKVNLFWELYKRIYSQLAEEVYW